MPRSKRDKKISLTDTKKKRGLQFKQQLIDEIRRCVDNYTNIFVFTTKNMRNAKLKDLRSEWRHSRFFFGKNKVMALAFGKTAEDEIQDNIHKLAKHLKGQCGLLFTNKSRDEVLEYFDNYAEDDYARAGAVALKTVMLPAGPLEQFPFSMEPHLRQLGLPTTLQKGVIHLLQEHTVCEAGKPLRAEQARILKLLGEQMAAFKLIMKCVWSKGGTFEKFAKRKSVPMDMEVEMKGDEGNDRGEDDENAEMENDADDSDQEK